MGNSEQVHFDARLKARINADVKTTRNPNGSRRPFSSRYPRLPIHTARDFLANILTFSGTDQQPLKQRLSPRWQLSVLWQERAGKVGFSLGG